MDSNLPVPNSHCEVLYRQTFNTYGSITTLGLTQDNRVGNTQKVANTRLTTTTNKGILAGSVVASDSTAPGGAIVPASYDAYSTAGDSTTYDPIVGIAVNDAVGNPYESSSAVASQKVVYCHGTGTVLKTDIYETYEYLVSTNALTYLPGQRLYASTNGLLTNAAGLRIKNVAGSQTVVAVVLQAPTSADRWMVVQLRV